MNSTQPQGYFYLQLAGLLLLILTLVLVGCDTAGSVSSNATATPFSGSITSKGPGSAGLTATALATPIPTVCPTYSATGITPASTNGWGEYKDPQYPLHLSVPTGWKAGAFKSSSGDGSSSYYQVLLLPVGSPASFNEYAAQVAPEYISLTIILSGPAPIFTEPDFKAEANSIMVSHTRTTLYDQISPDCQEVNRSTGSVQFSHLDYFFYLQTQALSAKSDIGLFLSVVQSFVYTG